jgi:hypothetical protein
MSEAAEAVRRRAGNRCEYCRFPQAAFRRGFHTEHIVARQHGGSASLDNLAFACWFELQSKERFACVAAVAQRHLACILVAISSNSSCEGGPRCAVTFASF